MKLEDLAVGMQVRVGDRYSANGYYSPIVGKTVTITHLERHPHDDDRSRLTRLMPVYVHCKDHRGSYPERNPSEAIKHLADAHGDVRSWYIFLPDVILLDNEECTKALPIW